MISRGKPSFDVGKQVRARPSHAWSNQTCSIRISLSFSSITHLNRAKKREVNIKRSIISQSPSLVPDSQPHTLNCLSYISIRRYWTTIVDSYACTYISDARKSVLRCTVLDVHESMTNRSIAAALAISLGPLTLDG